MGSVQAQIIQSTPVVEDYISHDPQAPPLSRKREEVSYVTFRKVSFLTLTDESEKESRTIPATRR